MAGLGHRAARCWLEGADGPACRDLALEQLGLDPDRVRRLQALQQHQGNIVAGDLNTAEGAADPDAALPGASVRWPGLTIVHRFGTGRGKVGGLLGLAGSVPRPPPSLRLVSRGGLLMP
jgi:hypothetical protein